MCEWYRGLKLHPGVFPATMWFLVCGIAGFQGRHSFVGFLIGAMWFVPVVLTCRSVAKANPLE